MPAFHARPVALPVDGTATVSIFRPFAATVMVYGDDVPDTAEKAMYSKVVSLVAVRSLPDDTHGLKSTYSVEAVGVTSDVRYPNLLSAN